MSFGYRFSPGGAADERDGWFRAGSVQVTTTLIVLALTVVGWIVFAINPNWHYWTAFLPEQVYRGQVWRILTWPFSWPNLQIFDLLTAFMFWYFGTEVEGMLGRVRFLKFLVATTLILSAFGALFGLHWSGALYTIGLVELMVFLLWVAEHAQMRFFGLFPAWAFGIAIVAMQSFVYLGNRMTLNLLVMLFGIVGCALLARAMGLLTQYAQIPNLARPPRRRRMPKRLPKAPRSLRKVDFDTAAPFEDKVVEGPWASQRNRDQDRLDALLDKIHVGGMDGLSETERTELVELSERLRSR